MFGQLAQEIKELTQLDPDTLTDEELSEAVVEMTRLRSSLEAAEARLCGAWDTRRTAWADDGARSGAAWLAATHPRSQAALRWSTVAAAGAAAPARRRRCLVGRRDLRRPCPVDRPGPQPAHHRAPRSRRGETRPPRLHPHLRRLPTGPRLLAVARRPRRRRAHRHRTPRPATRVDSTRPCRACSAGPCSSTPSAARSSPPNCRGSNNNSSTPTGPKPRNASARTQIDRPRPHRRPTPPRRARRNGPAVRDRPR